MHKQSGPIPLWGHSRYSFVFEMFETPNILEHFDVTYLSWGHFQSVACSVSWCQRLSPIGPTQPLKPSTHPPCCALSWSGLLNTANLEHLNRQIWAKALVCPFGRITTLVLCRQSPLYLHHFCLTRYSKHGLVGTDGKAIWQYFASIWLYLVFVVSCLLCQWNFRKQFLWVWSALRW